MGKDIYAENITNKAGFTVRAAGFINDLCSSDYTNQRMDKRTDTNSYVIARFKKSIPAISNCSKFFATLY